MSKITRDQITGMNFHYKHYPLEYFLDAMVRYECKNIELWGASPHFYVDELSLQDIKNIKREIDRRNLSVVCFTPEQCVYPINLAAREDGIRKRSIQYFIKSAEAAKELEAPLSQHGYQGSLTLEYTSYQYVQNPDEAMERTLDVLSGVLAD